MRIKNTKSNWWERAGAPPTEYDECYSRALRRMAVTLNCHKPRSTPFGPATLKKSDIELRDLFPLTKIGTVDANGALVNHERIDYPHSSGEARAAEAGSQSAQHKREQADRRDGHPSDRRT